MIGRVVSVVGVDRSGRPHELSLPLRDLAFVSGCAVVVIWASAIVTQESVMNAPLMCRTCSVEVTTFFLRRRASRTKGHFEPVNV